MSRPFPSLQSGKHLRALGIAPNNQGMRSPPTGRSAREPGQIPGCISTYVKKTRRTQTSLLLGDEAHFVDPQGSTDLVIEFDACWASDADQQQSSIRTRLELQPLLHPSRRSHNVLSCGEKLSRVVSVKNLKAGPTVRGDRLCPQVRGELVSRVRTNEGVLKHVAVIEVSRSIEFNAQGSRTGHCIVRIYADGRSFYRDHAPVQPSIQDVRFETSVRQQVRRPAKRANFLGKSFA